MGEVAREKGGDFVAFDEVIRMRENSGKGKEHERIQHCP